MIRSLAGSQCLLRIFSDDLSRHEHHSVYRHVLDAAHEHEMAGCTILRGIGGFGRDRVIHTEISLEGADQRAISIEMVDEPTRIARFWRDIASSLGDLCATTRSVDVHRYSGAEESQKDIKVTTTTLESHMEKRNLAGEHSLLRIFVGEGDLIEEKPLHLQILEWSKELGLAGCSTFRGVAGFGASSVVHRSHVLRFSSDLPILIEIVDTSERIHEFLRHINPYLGGTLVTEERVHVIHYQSKASIDS